MTAGKDAPGSGVVGGFVMCGIGGERQLVRVEAALQKRRALTRVESAETKDYVSGHKKLEEL